MLVLLIELFLWLDSKSFHFLDELLNFLKPLVLASDDHLVDLIHLLLVPFDLSCIVVTPVFKKLAASKHSIVLLDKEVGLDIAEVVESLL